MANRKPTKGDRCRISAEISKVWPDGKVSLHVAGYDYPVTVPESVLEDIEPKPKPVKQPKPPKHSDANPLWDET